MRLSTLMRAAALLVAVLGPVPAAQAAPITYTLSGLASGSLGGVPFVDQLVTVAVTGNTNNVIDLFVPEINASIFVNPNVATTVSIPGLPVALVTQPTAIYRLPAIPDDVDVDDELPPLPFVLIASLDNPPDLLELTGLGFFVTNQLANYDLRSSFGPLTSVAGIEYPQSTFLMTNRGALRFTSSFDEADQGTFSAAVSAVPEPSGVLLVTSGLVAVAAGRRRSRSRA